MGLLGVRSLFPISSGGDGWTVARPDGLASPRTLDYPRMMSEQVRNLSIRVVRFSENAILLVIGFATLYAAGLEVMRLIQTAKVELGDLFLLFIYAEVIGMVGAFYKSHRIPVTLPIIIAMTALCRMIILQSKDIDPVNILFEAGGILILAVAAFVMSMKDKMSLEKLRLRQDAEDRET